MVQWRRDERTLWRAGFAGSLVVLTPVDDAAFVVHGPGAALWAELEAPHSLDDIATSLALQYDVDAATIARDLAPILEELLAHGAVTKIA
jgi:hypothetical protein